MSILTLKSFPSTAKITATYESEEVSGIGTLVIEAENGTAVNYIVEADQCTSKSGSKTVSSDETVEISLNYIGSVSVDTWVPSTGRDTFPTHLALLGKGGWREVESIAERDAIPSARREAGMSVYVTSEKKLYILNSDLVTWTLFSAGGVIDIPTPSETELGNIIQYIGETTQDYTQGYFYKCISDGQDPATYSWVRIDVQPSTTVVDNVTTQSSTDALSANMGYELNERIDNIESRGRYLSNWNCQTKKPETEPLVLPYILREGDYYIVSSAVKAEPESCTMTITEGSTFDSQFQQNTYKQKVGTNADRLDYFAYTTMRSMPSAVYGNEKLVLRNQSKFSEIWSQLVEIANNEPDRQSGIPDLVSVTKLQFRWFYFSGTLYRAVEIFGLDENGTEYQIYSNTLNGNINGQFTYTEQQDLISEWLLESFGLGCINDIYIPQTVMEQETWHAVELSNSSDLKWTLNGSELPEGDTISSYGVVPVMVQPVLGDSFTIVYRTLKQNFRPEIEIVTIEGEQKKCYNGHESTVVETEEVHVNDTYLFDGNSWILLSNTQKEVSFAALAGSPYDNVELSNALDAKQDNLTSANAGTNISITTDEETGEVVISNTQDISGKVDKTDEADKVYGTDENGDQTTYDLDSFGKVDDVRLNGQSVVENKVANISATRTVSELPTIAVEDGEIVQYTGATTGDYIEGYFYKGAYVPGARVDIDDSESASMQLVITDLDKYNAYIEWLEETYSTTVESLTFECTGGPMVGVLINDGTDYVKVCDPSGFNEPSDTPAYYGGVFSWVGLSITNPSSGDKIVVSLQQSDPSDPTSYEWTPIAVENSINRVRRVDSFPCLPERTNEIVQYVGLTNQNYHHGYFYQSKYESIVVDTSHAGTLNVEVSDQTKFDFYVSWLEERYGGTLEWLKFENTDTYMIATYSNLVDGDYTAVYNPTGEPSTGNLYSGAFPSWIGLTFSNAESNTGNYLTVGVGGNPEDPNSYTWNQIFVQENYPVIDNVTSTSTTSALSANQGRVLQEQITHLKGIGRFLAVWSCKDGLPKTQPATLPYEYKTGDYYLVDEVIVPQPSSATISQTSGTGISAEVDVSTLETFMELTEDEDLKFWYTDYLCVKTKTSDPADDSIVNVVNTDKFDALYQTQSQIPSSEIDYPDFYSIRIEMYTEYVTIGTSMTNCYKVRLYRLYYNEDHTRTHHEQIDDGINSPVSEGKEALNALLNEEYGFELRGNLVVNPVIGGHQNNSFEITKSGIDEWTFGLADVDLSNYGIDMTGSGSADDVLTVEYTAATHNYRPVGTSYTGEASTVWIESEDDTVRASDVYVFDGTSWALQYNSKIPLPEATDQVKGIAKLYNTTGQNTDGSMTQKSITDSLNEKQDTLTAGTNITIAEDSQTGNLVISSTAQESFFRGRWANWSFVPSNGNEYPEDYHGNRKPTDNDFMVLSDASDYVNPSSLTHPFTVINTHSDAQFTIKFIDEYSVEHTYYYAPYQSDWVQINEHYSLRYVSGAPGRWYIRTNKPEDTYIVVDGIEYEVDPTGTTVSAGVLVCQTNYSTTPISGGLPSQVGQYQGAWRFVYHGAWDTNGKLGWNPQYQIENTLPEATDQVKGIAKLYNTTGNNTDGAVDQATITTELAQKISKYSTLPSAEDHLDEIVEFVGTTTANYTNGYFYKATSETTPEELQVAGTSSSTLMPDDITIDSNIWSAEVTTAGTYVFNYDGTNWSLDNIVVDLATYGITIDSGAIVSPGDNFEIVYTPEETTYSWVNINVQPAPVIDTITNAEIDAMWE